MSKAAVSHLVRELAISFAPKVRVNGASPATVVKGSAMFPRERIISSLEQYDIIFRPEDPVDALRDILAAFYAEGSLTRQSIDPKDCAQAIIFLTSNRTRCTTSQLMADWSKRFCDRGTG